MGPEGMRLEGPSLAPVGVNKHKLYVGAWREKNKNVKYTQTTPVCV